VRITVEPNVELSRRRRASSKKSPEFQRRRQIRATEPFVVPRFVPQA
jgi:hypothetical protein